MSIGRRLSRIVRSHLGSLRGEPFDEERDSLQDEDLEGEDALEERPKETVPPEVAEAYKALEVPVGSDVDTVKQGYRRMMKRYHQDRFDNDEEKRDIAGTVSTKLNAAYERLLEYLGESR